MCDSKNNNNRDTNINRTWLLKLLLAGLLIQHVAAASLATIVEHNFEDDNNDLPLVVAQSKQHKQPHHTVAVAATAANLVDSSVPAGVSGDGVAGVDEGGGGVGRNADNIVVDTLAEIDEYTNNDYNVDGTDAVNVKYDDDDNDEEMNVDMEFDGYLNDFNIQHEALIPDDILDQQHIEEDPEFAQGNNEADIILKSQRSTSRNFTTFHNNNKNDNNGHSNKNYNNDDNYRRKKKKTINNNKNHYKKFKSNSNDNKNNKYGDNNQHHGSEHATENKPNNIRELSDGSIKTEQKHHQQKLQHPQQQQQLLDINENSTERKFNKLSSVENLNDDGDEDDEVAVVLGDDGMTWSSSNNGNNNNNNDCNSNQTNKLQNNQNIDDVTSSTTAEQTAIGDIDNDYINEDEVGRTWQEIATDNDASLAKVADVAVVAAAEGDFASLASAGGATASRTTTRRPAAETTLANTAMQQAFVGRKTKRHGIRMLQLHLTDEQQRMSGQQTNDKHARHHYNNNKKDNDEIAHTQIQQHPEPAKSAIPSDYFAMTANDSNQDKDIRNHDVIKDTQTNVKSEQKDAENDTLLSAFEQHKALRRNNRRTGHKSHKKKYKDFLRYNIIATEAIAAASTGAPTTTTSTATATTKSTLPTTTTNNTAARDAPDKTKAIESQRVEKQLKQRQQQRLSKLAVYNKDMEKLQRLPAAAAPIFVVAQHRGEGTARPYYEGQLSYYMETKDDNDDAVSAAGGYGENVAAASFNNAADVGKVITSEATERNNNWYRHMSPILRNGMTWPAQHQRQHQQHHHHHHQHHNHHQQHHQPHHQHQQRQHQHHGKQNQAYQRRLSARIMPTNTPEQQQQQPPLYLRTRYALPLAETENSEGALPLAPLPPPNYRSHKGALQELGHQITQMEEFDRYYSKWPHLARVQYQLNDEDYREAHPDLLYTGNDDGLKSKPDAKYDYHLQHDADDGDEVELANNEEEEEEADEDANLPPYIKKYNRRNKQLLNLLEGTLPPPTPPPTRAPKTTSFRNRNYSWSSSVLQPGPVERSAVRIDDDYLKEKRRRYHNHNHNNNNNKWGSKNLGLNRDGEELKDAVHAAVAATATTKAAATKDALMQEPQQQQQYQQQEQQNHIPGDDVDISSQEFDDWEREIETRMTGSEKMKWQIEKTAEAAAATATTTSVGAAPQAPATTTTLKPAIFRLPSYPAFAGSYIGKPRSRSAQFAPSSGSGRRIGATANKGNGFINTLQSGNYKSMPHLMAGNKFGAELADRKQVGSNSNANISPNAFLLANYDSNNSLAAASLSSLSALDAAPAAGGVGAKPMANSFVYHRVEAAPRLVGAGSTGGRKQRLPFVAITDRRLETSKKSSPLYEQQQQQQRDFEQNHYPMP